VLGVWPGGRGVGGDDVVDRRVVRAVLLAGVGVLEVDVVGEVAGDGNCRGVGVVPVSELVQAAGVGRVGQDEAHTSAAAWVHDGIQLSVLWGRLRQLAVCSGVASARACRAASRAGRWCRWGCRAAGAMTR
jgi:hypothetical protein